MSHVLMAVMVALLFAAFICAFVLSAILGTMAIRNPSQKEGAEWRVLYLNAFARRTDYTEKGWRYRTWSLWLSVAGILLYMAWGLAR